VALLGLVAVRRSPRCRRWWFLVPWGTEVAFFAVWSVGLLMPAVARVRDAGPRMLAQNRLKEIGLAMHHYADDHGGRLPPAAVYEPDGWPLLSWRVLLLPYLEEQESLYKKFARDESWGSTHNLALLPRRPKAYAPPDRPGLAASPSDTYYRVFIGKGTAFEGHAGLRLSEDFPDGTANTVLAVEAWEAVPWTRPADLRYEPGGPLPRLGGGLPRPPSSLLNNRSWRPRPCVFLGIFEGRSAQNRLFQQAASRRLRPVCEADGERGDLAGRDHPQRRQSPRPGLVARLAHPGRCGDAAVAWCARTE
jgi:hypothetical protein